MPLPPDIKEELQRMKTLKVRSGIPEDLSSAIESFVKQAIIVGEYELDHMPQEYVENLLEVFTKYPEYGVTLLDLVGILERNEIIEN
jgi:hypothetical protein